MKANLMERLRDSVALEKAETLPVRVVVRVLLRHGHDVCVCTKPSEDGKVVWITFPGGGVEDNDTKEETVVKECLEEVGILVKQVRAMNIVTLTEAAVNKQSRVGMYSGIETHYYTAEYHKLDKSVLGSDNDAMNYRWVSVTKAIEMVTNGPWSIFTAGRIQALQALAH